MTQTSQQVNPKSLSENQGLYLSLQEMVKLYLNLPKIPRPDDAADALAIALTHAQTNKMTSQFSL